MKADFLMEWHRYFPRLVEARRIVLKGWPFTKTGSLVSPHDMTANVLGWHVARWRAGGIYFCKISAEEYRDLVNEREAKIEAGIMEREPIRERSDKGGLRIRTKEETKGKKHRCPIKSKPVIDDESDIESASGFDHE